MDKIPKFSIGLLIVSAVLTIGVAIYSLATSEPSQSDTDDDYWYIISAMQ